MGTCPICETTKDHIGKHFALSECGYPKIDSEKLEIIEGLLLGDGNISEPNSGNCLFRVSMTNEEFLQWLDSKLGWLSNGVTLSKTAEEASVNDLSGNSGEAENYNDVYRLITVAHPKFNEYREWYSSGEKLYPESIQMTPRRMEMWYVSDGSINRSDTNPRATLHVWNERDRPNIVEDVVSSTNINDFRFDTGEGRVYFGVEGTKDLLQYIGNTTIGFEYKYE